MEETERKFLVARLPDLSLAQSHRIIQGYISTATDCSEVRVRQMGDKFFQTIKGEGDLTRDEVEIELSKSQFNSLWAETEGRRIEKTRYEIPFNGNTIELDVYSGVLEGLVVAEVEFESKAESSQFTPPDWFGEEVTYDETFRNKRLAVEGLPPTVVRQTHHRGAE